MRIAECGMEIERRNQGSAGSLRSGHSGSKMAHVRHESRVTDHESRITNHAKAQWPSKAIWLQTQGRNGAATGFAARGVGGAARCCGWHGQVRLPMPPVRFDGIIEGRSAA